MWWLRLDHLKVQVLLYTFQLICAHLYTCQSLSIRTTMYGTMQSCTAWLIQIDRWLSPVQLLWLCSIVPNCAEQVKTCSPCSSKCPQYHMGKFTSPATHSLTVRLPATRSNNSPGSSQVWSYLGLSMTAELLIIQGSHDMVGVAHAAGHKEDG